MGLNFYLCFTHQDTTDHPLERFDSVVIEVGRSDLMFKIWKFEKLQLKDPDRDKWLHSVGSGDHLNQSDGKLDNLITDGVVVGRLKLS